MATRSVSNNVEAIGQPKVLPRSRVADVHRLVTLVEGVIVSASAPRGLGEAPQLFRQELDVRSRSVGGIPVSVSVVVDVPDEFGLATVSGDEIVVVGTTRRRFFRSGGATVSRTEIEADQFALNPTRRAREKLVASVVAVLTP